MRHDMLHTRDNNFCKAVLYYDHQLWMNNPELSCFCIFVHTQILKVAQVLGLDSQWQCVHLYNFFKCHSFYSSAWHVLLPKDFKNSTLRFIHSDNTYYRTRVCRYLCLNRPQTHRPNQIHSWNFEGCQIM